jgi:hypothetical protein
MNEYINDYFWPIIIGGVVILILLTVVGVLLKRRTPKLNVAQFEARWVEIRTLCKDKKTWPLAIINADKLTDDALKKSKFKGKTVGERLVAAQHQLSDNDGIWFAHKLRNKLVHENMPPLKQKDVVKVLAGFRQALRDLGAIKK